MNNYKVKSFSPLLKRYFVDEVIELYNEDATKEKIINSFAEFGERLTVHDSLFIMYAGHG